MNGERWKRIEEVFQSAEERQGSDRDTFLQVACAGDEDLRGEVESLLAQRSVDTPLDRPALEMAAGCRLGPYELLEPIGSGGMGTVFKARDTRLNRFVAIKVSSSQFSGRFATEARAVATLNHPHVCTLYDVGPNYLVMEFMEGQNLAQRLKDGALPLGLALRFAVEIADGVAAAHARGIVHRDLKPANIMLTSSGVKVLDFGLAKFETPTDLSRTQTASHTIVGTVSYMSPEQAEGKLVDGRTDIFSFGSVFYEMVTGKRPFQRDTEMATIAAVLREEPQPIGEAVPGTPVELHRIIERCLRKDPARRFQTTADLKVQLEDLREESDSKRPHGSSPHKARRSWRLTGLLGGGLAALAIVSMLAGAWLFEGPAIDITKHRYSPVVVATGARAISEAGGSGALLPVWSPDGKSIAYSGAGLRVQAVDGFESTPLTTEGVNQFFSADGSRIYYLVSAQTSRELWSVSVAGGSPKRVLPKLGGFGPIMDGAAESRDGKALVVVRPSRTGDDEMSVWVSSPPGAEPHPYPASPTSRDLARAHLRFSPDGSKLLVLFGPYAKPAEWWLLRWPPPTSAAPNTVRRLFENRPVGGFATSADWLRDNRHLIAAVVEEADQSGPLWIADTVTGIWRRITAGPVGFVYPRVSLDGRVLLQRSVSEEHAIEIPLDGSSIRPLLAGLRREQYPSWSPVAEQVLFVTDQRGEPEIWLASLKERWQRPVVTQRDFPPDRNQRLFVSPVFSPDGTRIAYTSKGAIWVSPVAGGPALEICEGYCPTWSPDGEWLAFISNPRAMTTGLMKVRVGHEQAAVPIRSPVGRSLPRWSPDGRWITIQLQEGFGVISPDGTRTKILYKSAIDWGSACGWSRDSTTLYVAYSAPAGRILSAFDVGTGSERRVRDLGPIHFSYYAYHSVGLSPSPDGKSLVGSTWNVRFEPWVLDGLEPPLPFWHRLFRR